MRFNTQRILNKLYQLGASQSVRKSNLQKIVKIIHENKQNFSIIFICSGNICRSAFAEADLNKLVKSSNINFDINIKSAGTHTKNGLPADSNAIIHARIFDIDLSSHKTTKVERELLESSKLILAMEPWHIVNILLISPSLFNKTFLLSTLDTELDSSTIDPYNKQQIVFENSFKRIRNCLNKLVEIIET